MIIDMRSAIRLLMVFCCLGPCAAVQMTPTPSLSRDEELFIASKVYSLLQIYSSSPPAESGHDLDGSYRNYLQKILTADDRRQFDLSSIEFVAQLHNGHTFFWDAWLDESNGHPLGFYAAPLEGKWVIRGSFLDRLKPGDIISKVDDATVEAYFLQQERYISGSSVTAQRQNLFLLPYLFPEHFTLTLEDGRQMIIDRAPSERPPEQTVGRWLTPGAIAYIRIPSFFYPRFEERALDYVREFRSAKVLIIDVRGNPGGISSWRLIRAVMDRPYRGWARARRPCTNSLNDPEEGDKELKSGPETYTGQAAPGASVDSGTNQATILASRVITPGRNAFRGRLILLVDGGCVSACEDFVEPSKASGRAILVGETTQGSSGLPFVYDFHNGMSLKIAVTRDYFPDGSAFDGVGIKPDVEVHTTIEDLKNGRDPVLEKALELAARP